jgi:hypothetical protein
VENSIVVANYVSKKIANAAENAFAGRAILLDENSLLFKQNNEKSIRQLIKTTVVSSARVLSYDIIEAQRQRDIKEAQGQGRCDLKRS